MHIVMSLMSGFLLIRPSREGGGGVKNCFRRPWTDSLNLPLAENDQGSCWNCCWNCVYVQKFVYSVGFKQRED
jgi:hypothetical protein